MCVCGGGGGGHVVIDSEASRGMGWRGVHTKGGVTGQREWGVMGGWEVRV